MPFRVPVTERTLFHLGSVGKHITALAVMQVVDTGSVALDAPVGGYVQGLPESWAVIPVRRLLTHTSGLPDYGKPLVWVSEGDRDDRRDTPAAPGSIQRDRARIDKLRDPRAR